MCKDHRFPHPDLAMQIIIVKNLLFMIEILNNFNRNIQ